MVGAVRDEVMGPNMVGALRAVKRGQYCAGTCWPQPSEWQELGLPIDRRAKLMADFGFGPGDEPCDVGAMRDPERLRQHDKED